MSHYIHTYVARKSDCNCILSGSLLFDVGCVRKEKRKRENDTSLFGLSSPVRAWEPPNLHTSITRKTPEQHWWLVDAFPLFPREDDIFRRWMLWLRRVLGTCFVSFLVSKKQNTSVLVSKQTVDTTMGDSNGFAVLDNKVSAALAVRRRIGTPSDTDIIDKS